MTSTGIFGRAGGGVSSGRFRGKNAAVNGGKRAIRLSQRGGAPYASGNRKIGPSESSAVGETPRLPGEALRHLKLALAETVKEARSDNWDGYGGRAITDAVIKEAIRFMELLPLDVPVPDIAPSAAGELTFNWYCGDRKTLSASIGAGARLAFAGLFGSGPRVHGIETVGDDSLFRAALRKLYDRSQSDNP